MNRIKTYVFDIRSYPYRLEVKATSIIEAKQKVKNMGHKNAYLDHIKAIIP